jgi:hypothetical protein
MEHQLVITIDCETAPSAADVGELFVALARDYKDITKGRSLVVARIEQGSIIAILTDWASQALPYSVLSLITDCSRIAMFCWPRSTVAAIIAPFSAAALFCAIAAAVGL